MNGWLLVNGFLNAEKYKEIYTLLQTAARKRGAALELKTNVLGEITEDNAFRDLPDFVLFWDKDILLARRLERLGVRLFNDASAVEICDRKRLTALALLDANLPMPKTVLAPKTFDGVGYNDLSFLSLAEEKLGFPMIVKEDCGSFGKQVYLVNDRKELESTVQSLDAKEFLMQEFIAESRGKDVRVNVVGDRAVSAILRVNDRDFRSNISGGGRAQQYTPTAEEASLAVRAAKACGLDFAGVDILFGKNGPLVCEVNSNPHFKSTLDCTGQDLSEDIMEYVLSNLGNGRGRE